MGWLIDDSSPSPPRETKSDRLIDMLDKMREEEEADRKRRDAAKPKAKILPFVKVARRTW